MITTTRVRLNKKIESLSKRVLALGAQVEEHVRLAIKAIAIKDPQLAARVIDGDMEIDRAEVDLEEECLEVLALHQPVAVDLRYIVAVMKIDNDLERIGDLAVNIAETAVFVASKPRVQPAFDYGPMAEKVRVMLKGSLDAFVNMDEHLAYWICSQDDEVDHMKHDIHRQFEQKIRDPGDGLEELVHMFLVSRHLERIADHATNIAEDVIYMVTGEIHRHRGAFDYRELRTKTPVGVTRTYGRLT